MSRIHALFVIFALAISCNPADRKPNVSVSGNFPGAGGEWIFLEEMEPLRSVRIDSLKADETGIFSFDLHISEAGFYVLTTKSGEALVLLLEPGEKVVLGSASGKLDHTAKADGSAGTRQLFEFERFMEFQRHRIDSLGQVYREQRGEPGFMELKETIDSLYLTYLQEQREHVIRFSDRHPGSLAILLMINRRLGQAEVFDEVNDFPFLQRVDSLLYATHPGNKHTRDHHQRIKEIRGRIFDAYVLEEKLRPGKRAPDVVLNDTSGNPVSLKSFTGKRVILYFWAGWDAQSRKVNRRLAALYPEIHKKNTELLGISFDENAVVWKGAIRLDNLPGIQLSDLKGLYSPMASAYNIADRLPYFYLIGVDQKIEYKHQVLDSLLMQLN